MKKWMLLILLLFAVLAGGAVWTERTLSPLRAQTETAWRQRMPPFCAGRNLFRR